MPDDIRYEYTSVRAVRGMENRAIAKAQKDGGWELVDQTHGMLQTTLNFRRVKPETFLSKAWNAFRGGGIMENTGSRRAQTTGQWRPTVSFWVTAVILFVLLLAAASSTGVAGILIVLGLFALLTGLYAFLFKRRSWAGLPTRKMAGAAAVGGLVITLVGGAVNGPAAATPADAKNVAAVAELTATPTPTATEASPALTECVDEESTRQYQDEIFVCTVNDTDDLVWMEKTASEKLVADRAAEKAAAKKAAAEKAAAEKAAAKKAAAKKAAAKKKAAEKAAAEEAAAAEAAAEQAAAEEAAAEQAQQAPVYVHPGAFCSGGVGVSKTGKPMVCAPASDGRNRWQSQ